MLAQVDFTKVTKIYLGKDHCCRCGCLGTYAYQGTTTFKRRQTRIEKMTCDEVLEVDNGRTYINLSLPNNKALTIYFG